MPRTSIVLDRRGGRQVARFTGGLLRPQLLHSDSGRSRVGLLATTALLLSGDVVELDVRVGPGARLDLVDIAGTVVYDARGVSSAWRVRLEIEEGAQLRYLGEPFVVSDGADLHRTLEIDTAVDASLLLRETVVLGRSGELGGRSRSATTVRHAGRAVLVEDQILDTAALRTAPGLLGSHRVVDTLISIGHDAPAGEAVTTYWLPDCVGSVSRWLGETLHLSPLHGIAANA